MENTAAQEFQRIDARAKARLKQMAVRSKVSMVSLASACIMEGLKSDKIEKTLEAAMKRNLRNLL